VGEALVEAHQTTRNQYGLRAGSGNEQFAVERLEEGLFRSDVLFEHPAGFEGEHDDAHAGGGKHGAVTEFARCDRCQGEEIVSNGERAIWGVVVHGVHARPPDNPVSLESMARIALISTNPESVGHDDTDLVPLRAALESVGFEVAVPSWRDPAVDWSGFELAIMRSPWDYSQRLPEFLDWLDRASALTRILNSPEIIRWNLDKRYMAELADRGVRVVESHFCTSVAEVDAALALVAGERVVVKPSVSAGSRDTGLFERRDPRARELAEHIIAIGKTAMVQPAIDSVARVGERALVYFDGVFSHALTKGPLLDVGGELLGGVYSEQIGATDATAAEILLADTAMEAMAALFLDRGIAANEATPLYARLDIVATDDGPALLEAELFEPSYFVDRVPGSEQRFASAVLAHTAVCDLTP
jgi:hypothetical protein